ncbi:MAG: prepilin-type N-terminal cleavage/methylation domain-containing protein, partial [Candidatus Omnitrophica bacterium]|nr:prepilin-type N-terminal cleavage/methylation domain-containing protein [Candidatus Omnitrophota bacterium]
MRARKGFTLIELLIVIAIILILIAIALPNFLEAQIRARVTRVKSEMRSVRVAMESYRTDNPEYAYPTQIGMQLSANLPRKDEYTLIEQGRHPGYGAVPNELTTPIAYFTESPVDYFKTSGFGVTEDMSIDNLPYGHPWMRYTLANREAGAFVWAPASRPILEANRQEWKSKRWIIVSLG